MCLFNKNVELTAGLDYFSIILPAESVKQSTYIILIVGYRGAGCGVLLATDRTMFAVFSSLVYDKLIGC